MTECLWGRWLDMDLTVQNIYGLVIRSQLLSLADARSMFDRWQKEAKDHAGNVGKFVKWMVANQYLTEYQASLLARGHADCFFLKEYKILERIGRGRMAGVYKAVHRVGQMVAIKVLPPSKAKDPQTLGRFRREARLAVRLKHPNIVRAFQVGSANGLHFIVMEYLEGETLADVIERRGPLPVREAVHLIYQALLGLQHIYGQGLIHRDLKPANLMLVPASSPPEGTLRSVVKILDIGLGRAVADESSPHSVLDLELNPDGMLLGTPDYLAPEQARAAQAADIRSDIYSLGCVLYHALAGQPPFPDASLIGKMIRHATEPARPLKEFNTEVADDLQQVVNRMMAKEPGERYPTPIQAAQALQPFLVERTETPVAVETTPRMRAFLTWLDTEGNRDDADESGHSTKNLPAAIPLGAVQGATPAAPVAKLVDSTASRSAADHHLLKPPESEPGLSKKGASKKERQKARGAQAITPQAGIPIQPREAFDVELVPSFADKGASGIWTSLRLTGRDLLLLGCGAGGIALAIFIGWFVARLLR